ncbi:MAG: hypothetical protein LUD46_09965 [Parabacteroides sp.]|nr:hypothetical protein [Parabacteroides sp.]
MQRAQPGGQFGMIGGQVVDGLGKVQSRLYFGCPVHPFYLPGFGKDEYGKVDVVGKRLEILQLALLLL